MGSVVRIERIIAGGDGLGREPEGRVVFVPRTAPGELVEIELREEHARWARAERVAILDPGPDRRDPPCPYYDRCGGCQIQHLTYSAQLQAKSEMIADALSRLGDRDVALPEIMADPEREFGYRNRVRLTLRRVGDRVFAGYRAWNDPARIVDVDHCPLAEPAVNDAWRRLRAAWGPGAERLPAGDELRLTLRATVEGEVGLLVERPAAPRDADEGDWTGDLEALARDTELAAIWSADGSGPVRTRAGTGALRERWGPHSLEIVGSAFLQVNRAVAPAMERYVRERCEDVRGRRVVDAYCGYGLRTLDLAREGASVVGIDRDPRAIENAAAVAEREGSDARFHAAPVEEAIAGELPADLVVLNPPRAGVDPGVAEALRTTPPGRVIYVSCDPATLARDLRRLGPGFRLADLRGFDLFPQTAHIEVVAALNRHPEAAGAADRS